MKQFEHEQSTPWHNRLLISKQQYTEFSILISIAVINQSRIEVTLLSENGNEYVVGIPNLTCGFQIQTDAGTTVKIPTERIADIRALT